MLFRSTSEEEITNAQGILPTASRWVSQKVTEPIGGIIGEFGAPLAIAAATPFLLPEEAAAGLGTIGVNALRTGVGTLAGLPTQAGQTLERQESLGQKDNLLAATASGLFKSALMNMNLPGMGVATKGIDRVIGPALETQAEGMARKVIDGEMTEQAAVSALSGYGHQLVRNMATATTAGATIMGGSEIADRLAAGQDLTSPEALEAYKQAGMGALELSPAFALLHGIGQRPRAKAILADANQRYEDIGRINLERGQRDLDITHQLMGTRAAEELQAQQQKDLTQQQINEVYARLNAEPTKSIQEIINEVTGVSHVPTKQNFARAWNAPSGEYISDPITQHERELTMGELHQMKYPELFAEEPVPEPKALPAPEMVQYPNGVVAHPDAVRNYITSLPEAERNAARAEFLGYKAQPVPEVPGIVTPKTIAPQDLINQQLGIGREPFTSTAKDVEAALAEPTGARVQTEGQIERPETALDNLKRNYPEAFKGDTLTSLDKTALEHMGFTKDTAGYTPLLKLGKDPVKNADKINDILDTHLKSNKTLNVEAINNYKIGRAHV